MATIPEALTLARQTLDGGDLPRARFIYEQVLQAAPNEPHALNGLGEIALESGRLDEAGDYLCRAIELAPHEPAFHNNLYETRRHQGRLEEAAASCARALELAPLSPHLHSNQGVIRRQQGDLAGAVASFRRALELEPGLGAVHYNLGNAYVKLEQPELAAESFRRALELMPHHADVHLNYGNLLQSQGQYNEALAQFEAAIAARAEFADAHHGRAAIWLMQGDYRRGWPEYEWRWKSTGIREPEFREPRWRGEPLEGRTIRLVAEQGLGDTMQFGRFAPLVKARGARILFQCSKALHELLGRTPGIDTLVTEQDRAEPFDYQIPLMSLPAVFGTTLESVPAPPYFFAEPQRVAHWRQEFAGEKRFKVGIVWQGSRSYAEDARRSFPLERFLPLAACPNVKLFSLQKDYGREQIAALADRLQITDLGATLDEETGAFVETAAVVANLDLVISPDSAMTHLAGGLGAPVWLAEQHATNWRWLVDRADSPWYPTLRIFRQQRPGDWPEVFARMADELRLLAARPR